MNLENDINYSQDFDYPDEINKEHYFDVSSTDIIIRLSNILFSSVKPKVTLAALLYGCGIDVGIYLGCDNQLSDIAIKLGESKQNFSMLVNKLRKEFGIIHSTVNKKNKEYKNTNYRKVGNGKTTKKTHK